MEIKSITNKLVPKKNLLIMLLLQDMVLNGIHILVGNQQVLMVIEDI